MLYLGYIRITIKLCDGQQTGFSDLFSCFPYFFVSFFAALVYGLVVSVGLVLLVIPGIIWAMQFCFLFFIIVDKGCGPIEALKKKGDLLELTIDPERRRYDPDTEPHHHLICVECKKIVDVHKEFSISVPDEVKGAFDLVGNHIEFYGVCPECKST